MSCERKFYKYHVRDKDGHIEMEIMQHREWGFTVHFPRYEGYHHNEKRRYCQSDSCFEHMTSSQLGMVLFAYSEDEYNKFNDYIESLIGAKNE